MTATKEQRTKRQAFCQQHYQLCRSFLHPDWATVWPNTLNRRLHKTRNGKLLVRLARESLGFSCKYVDADILTSLLKTYRQLICQAPPKPQA